MFYNGCLELHGENATWEDFKIAFRKRYNFMKLQTARQGKDESPQEFADRCRGLAQKIIVKTDDPVAQRIHREMPSVCYWQVWWRDCQEFLDVRGDTSLHEVWKKHYH
jgi:hypothetical protein